VESNIQNIEHKIENDSFFGKYRLQFSVQIQVLEELVKLAAKINGCICEYNYDQKQNRYFVRVIDSSEVIGRRKSDNTLEMERFDKIDSIFQNNLGGDGGLEHIIQVISLTDLYEVFSNPKIGIDIRTMIIENQILRKGIKTHEELTKIKNSDLSSYDELESVFETDDETILELKKTLRTHAQYLNLDKLLMIIAYRLNDALENGTINTIYLENCRIILETIIECLKNKNIKLTSNLQKPTSIYSDSKIPEINEVNYSVNDLKKCIKKFTQRGYITNTHCEKIEEEVANGTINFSEIQSDEIEIIFSREKLELYSMLSEENFIYVALKNNWDTKKIVDSIRQFGSCNIEILLQLKNAKKIGIFDLKELYFEGIISTEIFKKISEECDIEKMVNSYELIDYYVYSSQKSISEEEKEKRRDKLDKYLQLYKDLLADKDELNRYEISENLTIDILEKLNGEEAIELLRLCYVKDIICLETIAEWCGINIIEQFYEDKIITIDSVIRLAKERKISIEFAISKLKSIIEDVDVDYDEKIKYLRTGLLEESYISNLYKRNIIFEKDFRKLGELGLVSFDTINRQIRTKKLEDAEASSAIRITGIDRLEKLSHNIYRNSTGGTRKKSKQKIIDPIKREEYIRMLNAYRAITDLDEDSPFYNYEFYVIPDENGEIGLDSIVIAERYYEDKDTEERFAVNNATYFFKYKDLMVLSKFPKSKMTEEREEVVFTSRHIIATEKKVGSWASSVLYNLVRTRISSSLNEFSKNDRRVKVVEELEEMYPSEELIEIFDMGINIDQGEFNCEIEEPEVKPKRNSSEAR